MAGSYPINPGGILALDNGSRPFGVVIVRDSGSQVLSRYVTTLNAAGGMYYKVPRTVIPANADFEWEFELSPNADKFHVVADSESTYAVAGRLIHTGAAWNGMQFGSSINTAWRTDGKLHTVVVKRVGNSTTLTIDGVVDATSSYTGQFTFDTFGGQYKAVTAIPTFSGSFFKSKLTVPSKPELNHDYRFDDSDGVLVDYSSSGASGASVNVTANDREVMTYSAVRNAWVGSELVVNGDFSQGSTGWNWTAGWSIAGGKAVLAGDGTPQTLVQWGRVNPSDTYLCSFDVSTDKNKIGLQTQGGVVVLEGSTGTVTGVVKLAHTGVSFKRSPGGVVNGWIDNVSVKKIIEVTK